MIYLPSDGKKAINKIAPLTVLNMKRAYGSLNTVMAENQTVADTERPYTLKPEKM